MTPAAPHRHPRQCWFDLRDRELRGETLKLYYRRMWRSALGYREDTPIAEVRASMQDAGWKRDDQSRGEMRP